MYVNIPVKQLDGRNGVFPVHKVGEGIIMMRAVNTRVQYPSMKGTIPAMKGVCSNNIARYKSKPMSKLNYAKLSFDPKFHYSLYIFLLKMCLSNLEDRLITR